MSGDGRRGSEAAVFWGGLAAGAVAGALGVMGVRYVRGQRQITRDVNAFREHWAEPRIDGAGAAPRTHHPDDASHGGHAGGVVHYVALGDSAAQGVGASHVGASYVALLGRRIAEATGRQVAITNLSVSGAVSGDVVASQLPALAELGLEPDIVTLDIGGNDVVFAVDNTVESFARSFDEILDGLPAGSFVGDVPWFIIPGLEQRSKAMARRAVELIERHGHHLVPIYDSMRQEGRLRYYSKTAADWFHPNDRGHLAWADLFWERIEASGKLAELRAHTWAQEHLD
ncbi:MAG: SGNH/GDSL hydrolase family protein [Tessaracoccus sp.]|uniref:SGNH/GDSL hydrolase family protein n=1 Tax=Tessaracoccus sp. TaxID=1971211 RepID=UPI001ECCE553|nr:SGNH/GDSL hydrolase family protein [Tessaracoccus sp.]MBK7822352.1 SGNH/GDSL hydrolase family protein [Tessaracoccus sp.]